MNCPICKGKTKVVDTRHTPKNETYRKRQCNECKNIFFTMEFDVFASDRVIDEWNQCERSRLKKEAIKNEPNNQD